MTKRARRFAFRLFKYFVLSKILSRKPKKSTGKCRLSSSISKLGESSASLKQILEAHSRRHTISLGESGVVLLSATNHASELMSTPSACLPSAKDSTTEVPPPIKESKTQSPELLKFLIIFLANSGGKRAG